MVVLGHLPLPIYMTEYIYSFHVPLFFMLAGIVFSSKNEDTFKCFLKRKFNSILSPYITLSILTYLFWLFVGRHFGSDKNLIINIFQPLIGIFIGNASGHWMIHNPPLWFLPCLFACQIIFFSINNFFKSLPVKCLAIILFVFLGLLVKDFSGFVVPFELDTACVALLFFFIGYKLKLYFFNVNLPVYIGFSFLFIGFYISFLNGYVDMHAGRYNNVLLFFIGSISSIFGYILIVKKFNPPPFFSFFGRNTILILALHGIVISIVKGFLVFLVHVDANIFQHSIVYSLFFVACCFIFLIPVAIINSRYKIFSILNISH